MIMKLMIKKGIRSKKVIDANGEVVAFIKNRLFDNTKVYISDKDENTVYKSEIVNEGSETYYVLSENEKTMAKAELTYSGINTFPLVPRPNLLNITSEFGNILIERRNNKFYFLFNGKETGIVESIGPICRDIIDIGDAFTMLFYLGLYTFAFFMFNDNDIMVV